MNQRAEWRSASTDSLAPSVMTRGTQLMQSWSVGSWAIVTEREVSTAVW